MEPALRAGLGLAGSVLGAGLLLTPPVVAALAGPAAPTAWLVHLGGGALFSVALGLFAWARTGAASIAEVTGAVLGDWARRMVLAVYLAGFTVGQAAIALAAGGFLVVAGSGAESGTGSGAPAGAPAGAGAAILAMAVLAAAMVGAAGGVRFGDRARRWRLGATGLLAAIGCARPELFEAAGLLSGTPEGGHRYVGAAVFLLFFAGVGWESSARLAPALGRRGPIFRAVGLGATLVVAAYLTLALLLRATTPSATAPGHPIRVAALAAGLLLGLYCLTNLGAAARFVALLGGPAHPWVGAAVGAVSAVVVLVAVAAGWGVAMLLLIGPCVAAWIGYLLATLSAVRAGSGLVRTIGVPVLAGLIVLPAAAVVPLI